MAKVIEGYAYTTGENVGTGSFSGSTFVDSTCLESPKAFSKDLGTPVWLNHKGPTDAILLDAFHTGLGMYITVLVQDDELAEKCRGFSIGYTLGGLKKGKLDEISLICGEDRRPGNSSCNVNARRDATGVELELLKRRRDALEIDGCAARIKQGLADIAKAAPVAFVNAAEAARKKRFNAYLLRCSQTPATKARRKAWGNPEPTLGEIMREIEEE